MGIFDFLTGKTKLQKPQLDRLFAMSTAAVTLDTHLGLKPVGKAAISFKPFSSRRFRESGQDLGAMLESAGQELGSTVSQSTDEYGYEWTVICRPRGRGPGDAGQRVAETLTENGFGEQLLAAVFGVRRRRRARPADLQLQARLLLPVRADREGPPRQRARADLQAKLERELPFEPELERWFPLYGAPV